MNPSAPQLVYIGPSFRKAGLKINTSFTRTAEPGKPVEPVTLKDVYVWKPGLERAVKERPEIQFLFVRIEDLGVARTELLDPKSSLSSFFVTVKKWIAEGGRI